VSRNGIVCRAERLTDRKRPERFPSRYHVRWYRKREFPVPVSTWLPDATSESTAQKSMAMSNLRVERPSETPTHTHTTAYTVKSPYT
jgi:hypothetical protein